MMDSVPCPRCGNENTQPIIYGYASAEELELFEAGIWCYAGPIPDGEMPSHRCPECEHFWTVAGPLPTKRSAIRQCHFCDAALTAYDRQTFEHKVADYYQFHRANDHASSVPIEFQHHPFPTCQACQTGIEENQAELALEQDKARELNRTVGNVLLALLFALIATLLVLGKSVFIK
jgi:hypothetical protein